MSKSSRNQQCCLHFQLFLEQPIQQIFDIIKDINQHEKNLCVFDNGGKV